MFHKIIYGARAANRLLRNLVTTYDLADCQTIFR
jgi:hypothetical protein